MRDILYNAAINYNKMKDIAYGMDVPKGLDPFINLSFLALTVIPEIRITTTGVMEF